MSLSITNLERFSRMQFPCVRHDVREKSIKDLIERIYEVDNNVQIRKKSWVRKLQRENAWFQRVSSNREKGFLFSIKRARELFLDDFHPKLKDFSFRNAFLVHIALLRPLRALLYTSLSCEIWLEKLFVMSREELMFFRNTIDQLDVSQSTEEESGVVKALKELKSVYEKILEVKDEVVILSDESQEMFHNLMVNHFSAIQSNDPIDNFQMLSLLQPLVDLYKNNHRRPLTKYSFQKALEILFDKGFFAPSLSFFKKARNDNIALELVSGMKSIFDSYRDQHEQFIKTKHSLSDLIERFENDHLVGLIDPARQDLVCEEVASVKEHLANISGEFTSHPAYEISNAFGTIKNVSEDVSERLWVKSFLSNIKKLNQISGYVDNTIKRVNELFEGKGLSVLFTQSLDKAKQEDVFGHLLNLYQYSSSCQRAKEGNVFLSKEERNAIHEIFDQLHLDSALSDNPTKEDEKAFRSFMDRLCQINDEYKQSIEKCIVSLGEKEIETEAIFLSIKQLDPASCESPYDPYSKETLLHLVEYFQGIIGVKEIADIPKIGFGGMEDNPSCKFIQSGINSLQQSWAVDQQQHATDDLGLMTFFEAIRRGYNFFGQMIDICGVDLRTISHFYVPYSFLGVEVLLGAWSDSFPMATSKDPQPKSSYHEILSRGDGAINENRIEWTDEGYLKEGSYQKLENGNWEEVKPYVYPIGRFAVAPMQKNQLDDNNIPLKKTSVITSLSSRFRFSSISSPKRKPREGYSTTDNKVMQILLPPFSWDLNMEDIKEKKDQGNSFNLHNLNEWVEENSSWLRKMISSINIFESDRLETVLQNEKNNSAVYQISYCNEEIAELAFEHFVLNRMEEIGKKILKSAEEALMFIREQAAPYREKEQGLKDYKEMKTKLEESSEDFSRLQMVKEIVEKDKEILHTGTSFEILQAQNQIEALMGDYPNLDEDLAEKKNSLLELEKELSEAEKSGMNEPLMYQDEDRYKLLQSEEKQLQRIKNEFSSRQKFNVDFCEEISKTIKDYHADGQ